MNKRSADPKPRSWAEVTEETLAAIAEVDRVIAGAEQMPRRQRLREHAAANARIGRSTTATGKFLRETPPRELPTSEEFGKVNSDAIAALRRLVESINKIPSKR